MLLKIIHEFGILNVVIFSVLVHFYRYIEHLGEHQGWLWLKRRAALRLRVFVNNRDRSDSVMMTSGWSRRWSTLGLIVGDIDHSAHPGMNATLKSVHANRQV